MLNESDQIRSDQCSSSLPTHAYAYAYAMSDPMPSPMQRNAKQNNTTRRHAWAPKYKDIRSYRSIA